jgi:hypothetical protein
MRNQVSEDYFVGMRFKNLKGKKRFEIHIRCSNSANNQDRRKCQDLINQRQHIKVAYTGISNQVRKDYRIQLNIIVDCIHFLLCQGLAFRGCAQFKDSKNQRNFLKLLWFLVNHNQGIKDVVLEKSHGNLKIIAHGIQKDIVHVVAIETTIIILNDFGREFIIILIDKFRDVSVKKKMIVILCYVDMKGCVIEYFFDIVHVKNTIALSLKEAIETLFAIHGLNISYLYGKGRL